jgi:L-alanine-DL-glutamate epimerase-like enolase superfamily enzyme
MHRREFLQAVAGASVVGLCGSMEGAVQQADSPLSEHRLKGGVASTVELRWPRQVGKNSHLDVHGRGSKPVVVQLTTDQGATGWGSARGNAKDVNAAIEKLKGKRLSELFDPAVGITTPDAAALDFALHDLAGVILELPVYKMLGAKGPKATVCYSGMIYFDDLEPPENPKGIEQVMRNCQADVDYGYKQLKVKIGRGYKWMPKAEGLKRDILVTREIAKRFPGIEILVDGNDGFTCDEFIQYLEGIGDVKLFWIEEPFRETNKDYAQLRGWLKENKKQSLLADGEANPDWKVLDQLFKDKLLDVQLVDVVGYGFTPWRKLLKGLIEQGVQSSPHAWGHLLKSHYVAHLARGLGGIVTIEGVTCTSDDVDLSGYKLKDGKMAASEEPGFGMKLLKELPPA